MHSADQENIFIFCCSDENYVMPLAVMLKSLSVNHSTGRKIVVYVFGNITDASRGRILKSLEGGPVEIRFLKIDEAALRGMKIDGHISIAAYYRLIAPSLLPSGIKKIIYLDTDLILNEDIEKLWDMDIGENYILAVQEQGVDFKYVSSPMGLLNYKELGLAPDCKYFNSGVLAIDLGKWHKDDISLKTIEYIEKNKRYIRWHDQDGLNAVLRCRWGELDHRWNLSSKIFTNSSWEDAPVKDKDAYDRLVNHPYIIHFTTSKKPWNGDEHLYARLFFHYLDMTEWRGYRPKGYWRMGYRQVIKNLKSAAKSNFPSLYAAIKKIYRALPGMRNK